MKINYILIAISIGLGLIFTSQIIGAQEVNTNSHEIVIRTTDENLAISETIFLKGTTNETYKNISFWIQNDAQNIILLVNSKQETYNLTNNILTSDISASSINGDTQLKIEISYTLDKNTDLFYKRILNETKQITILFNTNPLYSGENLSTGLFFSLMLYEPTEAPLSSYVIIAVILLIIILVTVYVYSTRRKKTKTIKKTGIESEELLRTKKNLLMELLKDLEKQHRAQQITDDTYHKLKDLYKQDTIEVMRKLENTESKV